MTKILKLYDKNDKLIKQTDTIGGNKGTIILDHLEAGKTYQTGDFKICWEIDGVESKKTDIPRFTTKGKPISDSNSTSNSETSMTIIVTYSEIENKAEIKSSDITDWNDALDDYFYFIAYQEISDIAMRSASAKIQEYDTKQSQKEKQSLSTLNGKTGILIGDSITENNFRANKNYTNLLNENTGLIIKNLGVSGTGYQDRKNVAYDITGDFDFISIMLGTNDYGLVSGQRELGNAQEHKYNTVAGSIYYTFYQLTREFPTTPIVVLTPIPRKESNPFKETENNKSYTLGQLVSVIKELAHTFSLPVLDLYNESNLRVWDTNVNNNFFKAGDNEADGLHPNEIGHEWLYSLIKPFLESKATQDKVDFIFNIDTSEKQVQDNVMVKLVRPNGIFHKEDTSFILNIKKDDLDLTNKKVLKVVYNGNEINDPNGLLENSPYWYTLPTYEDGNELNQTSTVKTFTNNLTPIDITDSEQRIEYLRDYMEIYYTDSSNTLKGKDIQI